MIKKRHLLVENIRCRYSTKFENERRKERQKQGIRVAQI
jgi:hypothetical protein